MTLWSKESCCICRKHGKAVLYMGVKSAELHVLNGRERVFSAAHMKTRKKKDINRWS